MTPRSRLDATGAGCLKRSVNSQAALVITMDDKALETEKHVQELSERVTKLHRAVIGAAVFLVVFAFIVAPPAAGIATGAVLLCWTLAPVAKRLSAPNQSRDKS